jgi:phosphoglycolate phosphatase
LPLVDLAKYRHVIWDWNGTLLNDVWLGVEVMNLLLTRRGMPRITQHEYRERFDFPVADYYRGLGFDFTVEPFEKVAIEFIEEYERRRFECRLRDDALPALEAIRRFGIGQSLLSATQKESLREYVEHYGIADYFVDLVGLDDHFAHSKLENGKRWTRELGHDPSAILLIGDTRHDHEAASAMGVDCVLFTGGHQTRERLEPCGVPLFDSLGAIAGR